MSKQGNHSQILDIIQSMGGFIDENGMLQLKKGFCVKDQTPPHERSIQELAEYVEKSYGESGLCGFRHAEGKMIHQFRMYIDRHNIAYIRKNFKKDKMTDEEALAAYVQTSARLGGLGGRKLIREPARFHNKYPVGSSYWKYQRGHENKKRLTPDFHSEFIIDTNGAFVSQWNVLEEDEHGRIISDIEYYRKKYLGREKAPVQRRVNQNTETQRTDIIQTWEEAQRQIMDTESFNYASQNDDVHQRLDIQPPALFDTELRRQIAKEWKSPCKKARTLKDLKNLYRYCSDRGDTYSVSNS